MKANRLEKYRRRLHSRAPLIGDWLRRKSVEALMKDGSPEAARALAEAATLGDDGQSRDEMLAALIRLPNQRGIDAVCEVWASTRHAELAQLIMKSGWTPSAPMKLRVLIALKAGRLGLVTGGGAEVAEPLLQACDDVDPVIAGQAGLALRQLTNADAREALCRLLIERDHKIAREAVVAADYAPRDSRQRALFYFLTEQWEKYESLDFEHAFLRAAYEAGNEHLRERIAWRARQAGRVEWIEVVTGGRQKRRLGEMTNDEWSAALAMLFTGRRWDELWRLAQDAPPLWGAQILQRLIGSGWAPSNEAERGEYEQLAQLAMEWKESDLSSSSYTYCQLPLDCHLILEGHQNDVICLAISSDGRLMATGSRDQTVRLWSLPDGALIKTLDGHRGMVTCLAISPDGRLMASVSEGRTVRLWSLPDCAPVKTLDGHLNLVTCLAISPDGRLMATGSRDRTVRLWSLPDGALTKTLDGHRGWVERLAISPDGRTLASGSRDQTVRLWSLPDGALNKTLDGHRGGVNYLVISPTGALMASGSKDKTVWLWDLPHGVLIKSLEGHDNLVTCLAISPDGRLMASGSCDQTVRLWSLPDGAPIKTLDGHRHMVSCLTISPDGGLVASGSWDNTVRLWTLNPIRLCNLPIAGASLADFEWVQKTLSGGEIAGSERSALEFMSALMRRRLKFDIVVEETPQRVKVREFDIEIEG